MSCPQMLTIRKDRTDVTKVIALDNQCDYNTRLNSQSEDLPEIHDDDEA